MLIFLIFVGFLFFLVLPANMPGTSGVWAHLDFSWLLATAAGLSPFLRVVIAGLGGILQGVLDQTAWWLEALAMGVPLLMLRRIEEGLFIEQPLGRRMISVGAALLVWFIILFLGSLFGLGYRPGLSSLAATFFGFLIFTASGKGLQRLYEKILR